MTTLADLTRQTSRLVNRHATGSATSSSGNATTLIDTVGLAGYPDDQFLGGTIWLTSGANAGRSRRVTDFTDSSETLTFAAFPNNILSGVTYEVSSSDTVEYQDLRQAVGLALWEAGYILDKDETVQIVEGQLYYDLPAGVSNVYEVEVVENVGDDIEEKREPNTHWEEIDGQLVFQENRQPCLDTDTVLRIIYRKFHDELVDDDDVLDTQIDEKSLVYLAARQAMRLAYKRFGKAGPDTIPEWLNEAAEQAMKHVKANRRAPYIRVKTV